MLSAEVTNLDKNGFHIFGEIIEGQDINGLYQKMRNSRDFGPNLFLEENEYLKQKDHFGTNPTPTFNFLNDFERDLAIVERDDRVMKTLSEVLGEDYQIVLKKAVCGVPEAWIPAWIRKKIEGVNVANLGPYIKKEFRDITYFRGIDFHQDIIDWPQGSTDLDPSTFLTLYVYLHDVDEFDSPLHILPGTHRYGASLFPHQLIKKEDCWTYHDDFGNALESQDTLLLGKAGFVGLWHNCLLHGTQPVKHESDKFRLSIRYLIGKSNARKTKTAIDSINENICGPLTPIRTRNDLDLKGRAKYRGNVINQN